MNSSPNSLSTLGNVYINQLSRLPSSSPKPSSPPSAPIDKQACMHKRISMQELLAVKSTSTFRVFRKGRDGADIVARK